METDKFDDDSFLELLKHRDDYNFFFVATKNSPFFSSQEAADSYDVKRKQILTQFEEKDRILRAKYGLSPDEKWENYIDNTFLKN